MEVKTVPKTIRLWQKEIVATEKTPIFFSLLPENRRNLYKGNAPTKNAQHAESCALQGDFQMHHDGWSRALQMYNASLRLSPVGSEEIPFLYRKRGRCFYELNQTRECSTDIELARERWNPMIKNSRSLETLNAEKIEATKHEKRRSPQVDFDTHDDYPELAKVIELRRNETYGRHYVATQSIDVGKVLYMETSFASTTEDHNGCSACTRKCVSLVPCRKCVTAMFCIECRYNTFHRFECGIFDGLDIPGKYTILVRTILVAIILFETPDRLMEFVENSVLTPPRQSGEIFPLHDSKDKYRSLLRQHNISREFQLSPEDTRFLPIIYGELMANPLFAEMFVELRHRRFLQNLMVHHSHFTKFSDMDGLRHLYTYYRYFNHSCLPNVLLMNVFNRNVGVSMRPIKAGDQVFKCYFPDRDFIKEYVFRRNFLDQKYHFKCGCAWCHVKDVPFLENRLFQGRGLMFDRDFQYIIAAEDNRSYISNQVKRKELTEHIITLCNRYKDILWEKDYMEIEGALISLFERRIAYQLEY